MPSEVWLACRDKGSVGRGGENMNEFALHRPSTFWPPSPLQDPSLVFLPLTLSSCTPATSCHTFPLQRAYVSERMLCEARVAAGTGQRLIFVARPVCIPTACRRLRGQQLLPAQFPQPGVSPESLQTATARTFLATSGQKRCIYSKRQAVLVRAGNG